MAMLVLFNICSASENSWQDKLVLNIEYAQAYVGYHRDWYWMAPINATYSPPVVVPDNLFFNYAVMSNLRLVTKDILKRCNTSQEKAKLCVPFIKYLAQQDDYNEMFALLVTNMKAKSETGDEKSERNSSLHEVLAMAIKYNQPSKNKVLIDALEAEPKNLKRKLSA